MVYQTTRKNVTISRLRHRVIFWLRLGKLKKVYKKLKILLKIRILTFKVSKSKVLIKYTIKSMKLMKTLMNTKMIQIKFIIIIVQIKYQS